MENHNTCASLLFFNHIANENHPMEYMWIPFWTALSSFAKIELAIKRYYEFVVSHRFIEVFKVVTNGHNNVHGYDVLINRGFPLSSSVRSFPDTRPLLLKWLEITVILAVIYFWISVLTRRCFDAAHYNWGYFADSRWSQSVLDLRRLILSQPSFASPFILVDCMRSLRLH